MMHQDFESDPYPDEPRVLFIGLGEGSHTHSWIGLLDEARINRRLFALPTLGLPPDDWLVPCYVSGVPNRKLDPRYRRCLLPKGRLGWGVRHLRARLEGGLDRVVEKWLASVLRSWKPHIVHTLGLDPAGGLFLRTRDAHPIGGRPLWVLQLRGGSDLTLARHDPEQLPGIVKALTGCDRLVSDNLQNFAWAREYGVLEHQLSTISPVPGTGGLDLDDSSDTNDVPASARRMILVPKGYDSRWSKAMPVLEAIEQRWSEIAPCEIHILACSDEIRSWIRTLPENIQSSLTVEDRVSRSRSLELMKRARVMLAPSLIDGTPNTMFEAMASGALPIVSPLDTIRPVVRAGENVLFARNLYPDEIGGAVVQAMTDDGLVDRAADLNRKTVKELADRRTIRSRVVAFYQSLVSETD
jgi:hypothetical protein